MYNVAISADGLPIHYQVQGEGLPALVFIHGWSCDHGYWQKQIDHFASQYTVVAIDLGGHGDSGLNRDAWTMEAFGQDVVAVVEQLDLHQVVLVGHSMGGTVGIEAAQRMPERVIGIIGVDTFKNLGQTYAKAEIDTILAPYYADFVQSTDAAVRAGMFIPTSDAELVATIAGDMAAAPPQVGIGAVEQLFGHAAQRRAGLEALQVPIFLINSDFTPTDMDATARYGITVESMSGAGHFVMLEDPETFNRLLGNAVQKILVASNGE